MFCFLLSYSQTLIPSPQTVENNGTVTLTASDEFPHAHFGSITYQPNFTSTSSPAAGYGVYLNLTDLTYSQSYSQVSNTPSKFTFKISNSTDKNITVTLYFNCNIINSNTGGANSFQKSVTITVKPTAPVQTTFYNAALSRTFVKNNCDANTIGSSVTYTVPANKYSGSTQADADSKAQNDINANGQNYANANGQCLQRFYNTEVSGTFTKQCDVGSTGSQVIYTVPASKYSATSQAAADQLAANDLASNGQNFANANGVCNEVRDASVRYRAFIRPGGACITVNQTQIFVWVGDGFSPDSAYGSLVYSAASGTSKVPNGDYKIVSTLAPGQTPQSIYVYKVENGRIISSVVCVE